MFNYLEYCYIKNKEPYIEANFKTAIKTYNLDRFKTLFKNNECSIKLHAEFKEYYSTPPSIPNLLKIFNAIDASIKSFTPPSPTSTTNTGSGSGTDTNPTSTSDSTSSIPSPTSPPPSSSMWFNIISTVGVVFVVAGFVVAKIGTSKSNTGSTVNTPTDTTKIPNDMAKIPADMTKIPADTANIPIDTVNIPVDTENYAMVCIQSHRTNFCISILH